MNFHGQRWEYRIGNAVVFVDNAFVFSLRPIAQERLVVNDETVQRGSSLFRQAFSEPWLTMIGDEELRIVMTSRLRGIHCQANLAQQPLDPHAYWVAKWKGGRGHWPADDVWVPASGRSWIAR